MTVARFSLPSCHMSERRPSTPREHARAIAYGIQQARKALGPVNDDNWHVHAILVNIDTTVLEEPDPIKRRDLYVRDVDVTGWSLDWWPEYPDWVFDV